MRFRLSLWKTAALRGEPYAPLFVFFFIGIDWFRDYAQVASLQLPKGAYCIFLHCTITWRQYFFSFIRYTICHFVAHFLAYLTCRFVVHTHYDLSFNATYIQYT